MLDVSIGVKSPFVIFFPERSGSTMLVHLLNSHPEITCEHELFPTVSSGDGKGQLPVHDQESEKIQKLETVYSGQGTIASGFKFKFQGQYEAYPDVSRFFLRNVNCMRMIFLYRENLLKMAVSRQNLVRLKEMGEEHFLESSSDRELGKIELNLEEARNYIRLQSRNLKFFRRLSHIFEHRMGVSYEQLCTHPRKTLRKICRFLGVAEWEGKPEAPIRKITSDNLEQAIANYGELVDYFRQTRYASFLEA
ncbi:MAG: sulfotransferase [Planctomycetota bacterium]|nr:sulfotransferase [Planctomycetota bacterium]